MTPLYVAAQQGHEACTRLLLERGADVEARIKARRRRRKGFRFCKTRLRWLTRCTCAQNGNTPLHSAAYYGQVGTTRLLLAHGADVHALDNVRLCPPTANKRTHTHACSR